MVSRAGFAHIARRKGRAMAELVYRSDCEYFRPFFQDFIRNTNMSSLAVGTQPSD